MAHTSASLAPRRSGLAQLPASHGHGLVCVSHSDEPWAPFLAGWAHMVDCRAPRRKGEVRSFRVACATMVNLRESLALECATVRAWLPSGRTPCAIGETPSRSSRRVMRHGETGIRWVSPPMRQCLGKRRTISAEGETRVDRDRVEVAMSPPPSRDQPPSGTGRGRGRGRDRGRDRGRGRADKARALTIARGEAVEPGRR